MDEYLDPRAVEFSNFHIAHPRLEEAMKAVRTNVNSTNRSVMITVVGPSGIGKSLLASKLKTEIVAQAAPQLAGDRECIPVGSIQLVVPDKRQSFDFKEMVRTLLLIFDPIGIDRKMTVDEIYKSPLLQNRARAATASGQLDALVNAIQKRRPRAIILDEAHALAYSSAKAEENHLGRLKSVINLALTPFVLLGTYPLLAYGHLAPEILRRRKLIHFRRYLPDVGEDLQTYADIVATLEKALPIPSCGDFTRDMEFMFLGSLGCVGLLKQWMADALDLAIANKDRKIRRSHLEAMRRPNDELVQMLQKVKIGEALVSGVEPKLRGTDLTSASAMLDRTPISAPQSKRRRRPGTRNPTRDPVGGHR